MEIETLQKGSLLIAELALTGDASFSRSVVFLAEHNTKGSVGFILNKTITHTLSDLLPEIKNDFLIYKGGPVEQDNLYYLHTIPNQLPGSIEIAKGIYWGGDFEDLYRQLKMGSIAPKDIKFFLGYSGWMPEQLALEIKASSWIISNETCNILTIHNAKEWKEQMKNQGGEHLIWANSPENPSYN